jgi:hypothetical protein
VTYLRTLPDDDPNMDQNMKQSLNKTNVTWQYWTDLIFDNSVVLTAKKHIMTDNRMQTIKLCRLCGQMV